MNKTSLHHLKIMGTVADLTCALGRQPRRTSSEYEDCVIYEWDYESNDGSLSTIYGKKYQSITEQIDWNIIGYRGSDTSEAEKEVKLLLIDYTEWYIH